MSKISKKQHEVEMVVNYLKNENRWVTLRLKDIATLIGASATYANKILDLLREHPNLKYEEDIEASGGKKPYKFLYVNTNKDEILEENDEDFSDTYRNLTKKEVEFINEKLSSDGYIGLNKEVLFKIVNVIVGLGGRQEYVSNYMQKTCDLLIMTNNNLKFYINILQKMNIAYVKDNAIKLGIFNPVSSCNETKNEETKTLLETKVISIPYAIPISQSNPSPSKKEDQDNEPKIEDAIAMFNSMVSNLDDFKIFMQSFQNFFNRTSSDIKSLNINGDTKSLEEELEKGNAALNKCLLENKDIKEKIFSQNEEIKKMKLLVQGYKDESDRVFDYMHERLQVVIAEIMNTISEYVQMPDWKKNASENAKLQNKVVSAITSATEDILESHKNNDMKAYN